MFHVPAWYMWLFHKLEYFIFLFNGLSLFFRHLLTFFTHMNLVPFSGKSLIRPYPFANSTVMPHPRNPPLLLLAPKPAPRHFQWSHHCNMPAFNSRYMVLAYITAGTYSWWVHHWKEHIFTTWMFFSTLFAQPPFPFETASLAYFPLLITTL